MTDETHPPSAAPLPPSGWYADPGTPGQLRWWDGTAWSEHVAAAQVPTRGPRKLGSGFPALAAALWWLLMAQLVAYVAMALAYLWGLTWGADSADLAWASPAGYDLLEGIAGTMSGLAYFATAVIWCIWQFSLARATLPGAVRRSPGMHVASWFIPIVSLWFPFQNMRDLWRVHVGASARGLLGWWWALWIVTCVTVLGLLGVIMDPETTFRAYNVVSLVDAVAWIAGIWLAMVVVRRLSSSALSSSVQHGD